MAPEVFIRQAALSALADRVVLRDPAGRSARPHLTQALRDGERGFLARGAFLLNVRYRVARTEGVEFCRATGDLNPIHLEGDIVPGAYTAAKVLLPVEVLLPEVEIAAFAVKFSAIAEYGRALFTTIRFEPRGEGAAIRAVTQQDGAPIAEIEVRTRMAAPPQEVARRKVNVERVKAVRAFIRSLRVAPHAYFRKDSGAGYHYPTSFLAALPSGAMVRQLRGEGGLLNKLALSFEGGRVPITGKRDPTVEIEHPRARRTFNRIIAAITDGIRTYVRGSALVLNRDAERQPGPIIPLLSADALPEPGT